MVIRTLNWKVSIKQLVKNHVNALDNPQIKLVVTWSCVKGRGETHDFLLMLGIHKYWTF